MSIHWLLFKEVMLFQRNGAAPRAYTAMWDAGREATLRDIMGLEKLELLLRLGVVERHHESEPNMMQCTSGMPESCGHEVFPSSTVSNRNSHSCCSSSDSNAVRSSGPRFFRPDKDTLGPSLARQRPCVNEVDFCSCLRFPARG